MNDVGKILILGAGPTGLGSVWRLKETGYENYQLLEASDSVGGLAGSVVDQEGFTWDLGGHVHFSHYDYYDRVLDSVVNNWIWHQRNASVRLKGNLIPYPIQRNFPEEIRDMGLGYKEPVNYLEWLRSTFGNQLCELFFFPYNQKIWGYPLEKMSYNWIRERVALPSKAAREYNRNSSWGPNQQFRYPGKGGTGRIWNKAASYLKISSECLGQRVVEIDLSEKLVSLENGKYLPYSRLISSIPLDDLCRMSRDLDPEIKSASEKLASNRILLLGLGLKGDEPEEYSDLNWIYFPEPSVPFYRVSFLSRYSPAVVPCSDAWSILVECCLSHEFQPEEDQLDSILSTLIREGLVDQNQIVSMWSKILDKGYPIPSLERDTLLNLIQTCLEEHGIFSRGRFGGWKYEVSNQDHSFMQGVEVVNRLLFKEQEQTY